MKISKLIIAAMLTLTTSSYANAKPERGGNHGENLPINTEAWVLLIAGFGIGYRILTKKANKVKLQTADIDK